MFRVQYSLELREDPSSKGWKEAHGEVVASLIVSKFVTSRLRLTLSFSIQDFFYRFINMKTLS